MKHALFVASLLLALPVLAQTINPNIENITPDSRYTVNSDGTATDNDTGLMWMQCSEGQAWESNGGVGNCTGTATTHTWDDALVLVNGKTFAGYSDWRLPDIRELSSLVAEDRYDPAINSAIFPVTPPSSFWSASQYIDHSDPSWIKDFGYGYADVSYRYDAHHVRLVRSGE